MGVGGLRALRGVSRWQGLCGHTHFQQGLNMTRLFQNGLLIYIHQRFKGSVMSAEIEALTGALDSFSLTLF